MSAYLDLESTLLQVSSVYSSIQDGDHGSVSILNFEKRA